MTGRGEDLMTELLHLLDPDRLLTDPRASGEGVRVAVLDSGVDRDRLAARCQLRGQTLQEIHGALFRDDSIEPLAEDMPPSNPHGTIVADVLLTLAPQIHLYSGNVFGSGGSCDVKVLIRAIRHAVEVWKCHIVNLSLGVIEQRLQPVQRRLELMRTVEEAYYRDVLIVAAAHNDHPVTRSFPAVFAPPLLSVGRGEFAQPTDFAYDLRDQVEFRAHGRAYLGPLASVPATSWAAPHLSAVAAKLLSICPGLKPFEIKTILYWMQRSRQLSKSNKEGSGGGNDGVS